MGREVGEGFRREGTQRMPVADSCSCRAEVHTCCTIKEKKTKSLSHVRLFATPQTVAHQTPPSMGFSRQEYWSGLPFPSPRDVPNPGTEPRSPAFQADVLPPEPPGKPDCTVIILQLK